MARSAYVCEICYSPHETLKAAEACESLHCSRDGIKVHSLAWEHSEYAPSEVILEIPPRPELEAVPGVEPQHCRYMKVGLE